MPFSYTLVFLQAGKHRLFLNILLFGKLLIPILKSSAWILPSAQPVPPGSYPLSSCKTVNSLKMLPYFSLRFIYIPIDCNKKIAYHQRNLYKVLVAFAENNVNFRLTSLILSYFRSLCHKGRRPTTEIVGRLILYEIMSSPNQLIVRFT